MYEMKIVSFGDSVYFDSSYEGGGSTSGSEMIKLS